MTYFCQCFLVPNVAILNRMNAFQYAVKLLYYSVMAEQGWIILILQTQHSYNRFKLL